ncbi:unnamed protein product, partial [Amoebophrya sp. A25]|eukprot:GSA25T00026175001.1
MTSWPREGIGPGELELQNVTSSSRKSPCGSLTRVLYRLLFRKNSNQHCKTRTNIFKSRTMQIILHQQQHSRTTMPMIWFVFLNMICKVLLIGITAISTTPVQAQSDNAVESLQIHKVNFQDFDLDPAQAGGNLTFSVTSSAASSLAFTNLAFYVYLIDALRSDAGVETYPANSGVSVAAAASSHTFFAGMVGTTGVTTFAGEGSSFDFSFPMLAGANTLFSGSADPGGANAAAVPSLP